MRPDDPESETPSPWPPEAEAAPGPPQRPEAALPPEFPPPPEPAPPPPEPPIATREAPATTTPGIEPGARRAFHTWVAGFMLFAVALILYVATLMPTVGSGETARLQAHAVLFGLGGEARDHPLTVGVEHLFTRIEFPYAWSTWLPLGDQAYRANLASGVVAALCILVVFLTALAHLDASRIGAPRHRLLFAAAGASSLAVAHTFWARAVVAHHTPVVALLLALATAFFVARMRGRGAWTILVAMVLFALAIADQRAVGLLAPIYLIAGTVMLSGSGRPISRAAWFVVIAFIVGLVPLILLATLELVPTPQATATVGDAFRRITGGPESLRSPLDALTIVGTRLLASFLAGIFFAVVGFIALLARSGGRREGLLLLALLGGVAGASLLSPEAAVVAWAPITVGVAVGAAIVMRRAKPATAIVLAVLLIGLPIATYAFLPRITTSPVLKPWIATAFPIPSPGPEPRLAPWRQGDRFAREDAEAMLAATPRGAFLVTDRNRLETFRYLNDVEQKRPDVVTLTTSARDFADVMSSAVARTPIAVGGLSGQALAPVQREVELVARGPIALARPRPLSLVQADRLFAEHRFWEAAFSYGEALTPRAGIEATGIQGVVEDPEALARWIVSLTQAELPERARAVEPRYLAAAGDTVRAHVRLGELFAETGGSQWAEDRFAEALAASPSPALAAYLNGAIAEVRGQDEEARKFYERALKLNPNQARARARLARLNAESGSRH